MVIAIGSTNQVKVQALEEVLKGYPFIPSQIVALNVPSGISEQPMSLEETIQGAKNRAKNVFESCSQCSYGFGIESGLKQVTGPKTGFMECTTCCIYNGHDYYFGQSCAFELPSQIVDLIVNNNLDLAQACFQAGLTQNPKLGAAEGIIGVLTKGRINRKEYTKQAIITALIQIENPEIYLRHSPA